MHPPNLGRRLLNEIFEQHGRCAVQQFTKIRNYFGLFGRQVNFRNQRNALALISASRKPDLFRMDTHRCPISRVPMPIRWIERAFPCGPFENVELPNRETTRRADATRKVVHVATDESLSHEQSLAPIGRHRRPLPSTPNPWTGRAGGTGAVPSQATIGRTPERKRSPAGRPLPYGRLAGLLHDLIQKPHQMPQIPFQQQRSHAPTPRRQGPLPPGQQAPAGPSGETARTHRLARSHWEWPGWSSSRPAPSVLAESLSAAQTARRVHRAPPGHRARTSCVEGIRPPPARHSLTGSYSPLQAFTGGASLAHEKTPATEATVPGHGPSAI
jgi:hypothetical protein